MVQTDNDSVDLIIAAPVIMSIMDENMHAALYNLIIAILIAIVKYMIATKPTQTPPIDDEQVKKDKKLE